MPRGRKDIYKDAKGFDKNPQNINRSGANRKTWTKINKDLASKGVERVSKDVYYEFIGRFMNMTVEEVDKLEHDSPQWIQWLIKDLRDSKVRSKIMSEYRDWMFGKAEIKVDVKASEWIFDLNMDALIDGDKDKV